MLNKNNKQSYEKDFIQYFLLVNSNTFLINLKNLIDSLCLSDNISQTLAYHFIKDGGLIYRYGDIGTCFYVLIKGNISVLTHKSLKIKIKLKDYYSWLIRLIENDEKQILVDSLTQNSNYLKFTDYSQSDMQRIKTSNIDMTKEEEF